MTLNKQALEDLRVAALGLVKALDTVLGGSKSNHGTRTKMSALCTVEEFATQNPFTEPQIRYWIYQEQGNGLKASGAVVRIGRRVYIDADKFSQWIDSQQPKGGK